MDDLAQLFQLLSEPVRLNILGLLTGGEQCVCKLYGPLNLPQSTVSRHLSLLRNAGLVAARRQGTWMHYRLSPESWKAGWREILPRILTEVGQQTSPALASGNGCGATPVITSDALIEAES